VSRLFLLLTLCLCCHAVGAEPVLASDKLPILRINTNARPQLETGLEIGRQSKALFPDIEQRYDTHLATILTLSNYEELLDKHLPPLLAQLEPAYLDEMQGVAGAWVMVNASKRGDGQLSLAEYQLLNLLPDMGLAPNGTGIGVFGKAAALNSTMVGRNLDWRSTAALRGLQAITVYENTEQSVVNIGFAGMLGIFNGFNNQGLFLGRFNAEPYSPYLRPSTLPELSLSGFSLRQALATQQSGNAAKRWLTDKQSGFSTSILIADKETVQVLEYFANDKAQPRAWNSAVNSNRPWDKPQQIAVVDCLILDAFADHCHDVNNGVRWQRLREQMNFSADNPASFEAISALLFDTANQQYEIFNAQTLQSLVYFPTKNRLYLYAIPENGEHSATPVHVAYLDLLPATADDDISLVWVIWLLLFAMLGGIILVRKKALTAEQLRL